MQPLVMQRGYNNKFYFVERDKSDSSDVIYELHVYMPHYSSKWTWTKKPIYELPSGRIISLEMDYEGHFLLQQGLVTKNGQIVERDIINKIYIIDDQYQLLTFEENFEKMQYDQICTKQLSEYNDLDQ